MPVATSVVCQGSSGMLRGTGGGGTTANAARPLRPPQACAYGAGDGLELVRRGGGA